MRDSDKHREQSIEQLEDDYWPELKEEVSGLIRRCHSYRKVPLRALSIEQLRTLITQNIGTEFILPIIIEILEENPITEGELYEGDLLEATADLDRSTWVKHPSFLSRFQKIINENKQMVTEAFGIKKTEKLEAKINSIAP